MSYRNYQNPVELPCWKTCTSCNRCSNKGRYAKCSGCSGRIDPKRQRDPYDIDDYCRCAEGIMQYRAKNGRLLLGRFLTNPFGKKVITDAVSEDERDWNQYVDETRERLDDPTWDGVRFNDGSSTTDWMRRARG